MAKVVLARSARNALAKLDFLLADAILNALGELEHGPETGHALRGRLTGLRSHRVGVYRSIYELRDPNTVRVVAIRHRGQAYDTIPADSRRPTGSQLPRADDRRPGRQRSPRN